MGADGGGGRATLAAALELVVPGSAEVGAVAYAERLLLELRPGERRAVGAAVAALVGSGEVIDGFAALRAIAIESYYSGHVAAGSAGTDALTAIGFHPPTP